MSNLHKTIHSLAECYSKLIELNSKFCLTPTVDTLNNLNNHRAILTQEIEALFANLQQSTEIKSLGDKLANTPLKAISCLAKNNKEMLELKNKIYSILERLVQSDKAVEEVIQAQSEEIKSEIKKLRRGAKKIRGYIQKNPTGSCFINKIK